MRYKIKNHTGSALHMAVLSLLMGMVVCMTPWGRMEVHASTFSDIVPLAGISGELSESMTRDEYIAYSQENPIELYGYTKLGICQVESGNLNVRQTASTEGKLVGKLPNHGACEIISYQDGWAYVRSGEVEGYVSLDYLLTGPSARVAAKEYVQTVAIALTDGLNIREEPTTDSSILTQVLKDQQLEYVDLLPDGWVQVSIDGEDAFVFAEYVSIEDHLVNAITMTELLYGQGISDVRVDLVEYAKQFLGNPYVWGGTSLTKGADCSGFVLSIFKHYGYTLSHSSRAQANEGTKLKSASDLLPGDLIFYGNSKGTINHVAIYIGNNQVIHASSPKYGIRITQYNYRTPLKYVRIIKD